MSATNNRDVRGCILRTLYEGGKDNAMSQRSVERILLPLTVDIAPYIRYLKEKGYIRNFEIGDLDTSILGNILQLTTKGVDLVERSIPADPGVIA